MTIVMNVIAVFAKTFVISSLAYYTIATVAALRFARRRQQPSPPLPQTMPLVAVIKPLRGRNQCLAANLTSYLKSDYPRTQFYFAVDSENDPAAELTIALRDEYKSVPITMLVTNGTGCANRKVGKLIQMANRAADASVIVLSDADIAVTRDHLRRIVGELLSDEKIGIVTCPYSARPIGSFASRLEALFINTDFTPQVMLASAIEPLHYAFGATIAIKRKVLDAFGGFARIKDLLADDFYLGKLASDAGYEVRLSSSVVTTVCEERRFKGFWRHQLRWARTYRTTRPSSLATIVTHGPFWALLLVLASGFSFTSIAAMVAVLTARIGMAQFLMRSILGLEGLGVDALLTPVKDLIMTAVWFASLLSNEVEWGGRRLRILPDGAMREMNG